MTYTISALIEYLNNCDCQVQVEGLWYPSRPKSVFTVRLHAAWLVLTGRADAVVWPGGQ